MRIIVFFIGLSIGAAALFAQGPVAPEYKIVEKIQIGGEGGWDYISVDDSTGRLFVSHATKVEVMDPRKGSVIGVIPDTKGVHGIAIAADLGKGFVSNGKDSSVTVFDLKTLKVLAKVAVTGLNPDAILYDAYTHQVFTFNGKTANATVIDGKKDSVVATIALDGKPEAPASDGKGTLFVNIEDKNMVEAIKIDSTPHCTVTQRWPVAPGIEPSGLALDKLTHRLFIVCGNNRLMVIMNSETGKIVATMPIGRGVDGVVFDPFMKRAYSSNGEGTVTVVEEVSADSFKVIETIPTQKGARTCALNALTHHIYLPTAEFGETPAPTKENLKPQPPVKPGTFTVLDIAPVK